MFSCEVSVTQIVKYIRTKESKPNWPTHIMPIKISSSTNSGHFFLPTNTTFTVQVFRTRWNSQSITFFKNVARQYFFS